MKGGSAKGYLPGFCLPGGLVGLLPMYLNSLRTPIAAQKIALLEGVRLMIALTNDEGTFPPEPVLVSLTFRFTTWSK